MPESLKANQLSLHDVKEKFQIRWAINEPDFFTEWRGNLPSLEPAERYWLDRAKEDFLGLLDYQPNEELAKIVILAPLLSVASMYRPPFLIRAEQQVEIEIPDPNEVIRGRVDILVTHQQLWVAVVESKRQRLAVLEGLPQALFYMMGAPNPEQPLFGLMTNGTEFLFVKLVRQPVPKYALSEPFSLLREGDFHKVLGIFRKLGVCVTQLAAA